MYGLPKIHKPTIPLRPIISLVIHLAGNCLKSSWTSAIGNANNNERVHSCPPFLFISAILFLSAVTNTIGWCPLGPSRSAEVEEKQPDNKNITYSRIIRNSVLNSKTDEDNKVNENCEIESNFEVYVSRKRRSAMNRAQNRKSTSNATSREALASRPIFGKKLDLAQSSKLQVRDHGCLFLD
ncbi:hypothetical protein J6590_095006 [Homalodisca vitripennis]|nr:hypothetical protein J6590_095006 [Homalodisca vitripennis]